MSDLLQETRDQLHEALQEANRRGDRANALMEQVRILAMDCRALTEACGRLNHVAKEAVGQLDRLDDWPDGRPWWIEDDLGNADGLLKAVKDRQRAYKAVFATPSEEK